jgi:uncharacterized repeat protein (TIGR01451 family)
MTTVKLLATLGLLALSAPALAAPRPDLVPTVAGPSGAMVYESATWTVSVTNIGNATANTAQVRVTLPRTGTSPTVYRMGTVDATSASCASSGLDLVCTLGNIKRGKSVGVWFDLTLPQSSAPLVVRATTSFAGTDGDPANDTDSETASLVNYSVSLSAPAFVTNEHCTGTGLTSFYECELFPSSLSSHDATLEADGSITLPDGGPDYGGSWWQDDPTHLGFVYTYLGDVVAEFEGWGVSAACWEGVTTFPGSTYVSPYQVCQ